MALRTLVRPGSAVIEPGCYHVDSLCGPSTDVAKRDEKLLVDTNTRVNLDDGRYIFFRIQDACRTSAPNTIALGGFTESGQRIIVLWNYLSQTSSARFGDRPAIPHQPLSA